MDAKERLTVNQEDESTEEALKETDKFSEQSSTSGEENSGGEEDLACVSASDTDLADDSSNPAQNQSMLMDMITKNLPPGVPRSDDYANVDDWVRDMLRYVIALDNATEDSVRVWARAQE